MRRFSLLFILLASACVVGSPIATAQSAPTVSDSLPAPETVAQDLDAARQDHLWRVAVWGGANVLGGLALVLGTARSQRTAWWHFGAMSAGWGAVNMGIAAIGTATASPPPADPAAVLAAERQFHDILLFNLGLNVAYSAVGGTMMAAGYREVANAARWRGIGTSLVLQGAGLLVLDGIALVASRTRLDTLLDAGAALSLQPHPSGLTLTIGL